MSKSALTVLREARELISDPRRWTTDTYAIDGNGVSCLTTSSDAKCWCSLGAVQKVARENGVSAYDPSEFLYDFCSRHYDCGVAIVNDTMGHSAVLRMFDAAIASAEKEAGNAVQA